MSSRADFHSRFSPAYLAYFGLAVAPAVAGDASIAGGAPWRFDSRQIAQVESGVFGMCVADLVPETPGPELVTMTGDGRVVVLSQSSGGWVQQTIASGLGSVDDPRFRPTIAVGDFHSGSAGEEIVVSYLLATTVVRRNAQGTWIGEVIRDAEGRFGFSWGVRTGELDSTHAGEELIQLHEGILDFGSLILTREVGGAWDDQWLSFGAVPGPVMMDARVFDHDATHAGNEIFTVTEMGPAGTIIPPDAAGGEWEYRALWNDFENAGWVIAFGDVDLSQPGAELVVGTRYHTRILVANAQSGGPVTPQLVLDAPTSLKLANMLDVAVAPLSPAHAGEQIVGVDYTGRAHLVWHDPPGWRSQLVHSGADPLLAVAIGDFAPSCPTPQVVIAGNSGALWLLTPTPEGDLDSNLAVDLGDLATLLSNFGMSAGARYEQGDADADGDVDLQDLARLLRNFGSTCA
ncbi:MAG: hypothetical protein ACKVS9_15605 [Phycisphaerae bacterium]